MNRPKKCNFHDNTSNMTVGERCWEGSFKCICKRKSAAKPTASRKGHNDKHSGCPAPFSYTIQFPRNEASWICTSRVFFCTMPLGLAFKIGCQQDVFWIWWSYLPASYNSPGPGNATCWPSGNQQQNHLKPPGDRGIQYMSCMCQNNTQLTMKSWSCHKHGHLCKPGSAKMLHLCNHRLQWISLEHLWDHRLGPMASDGLCISSSLVTLNSRNEFLKCRTTHEWSSMKSLSWHKYCHIKTWMRRRG